MQKTSATDPIRVAFIDQAVLGAPGALGITIAPGKRALALDGLEWARDLDADLARIRQRYGIHQIVSLLEPREQHRLGIYHYRRAAQRHGLGLVKFPIPDGGAPSLDRLRELARQISARLDRGERVLVHCRGGLGRSGLVAAAVLVVRGLAPARAIAAVRAVRPGAIENPRQVAAIHQVRPANNPHPAGAWLGSLTVGPGRRLGGLDVFPVLGSGKAEGPDVLLLHELPSGVCEVREIAGGARVPEVEVVNKGARMVLIIEGDTLVGCQQNRVVTRTTVVPGKATVRIQVGCMERGRWAPRSSHFEAGAMRMDREIRRHTAAENVGGDFDQLRLWSQVESRLRDERILSETSDYHTFIASRADQFRAAILELQPAADQVGVLVLHGEELVALEVAASAGLWRRLAPRALPGLLMGAERLAARDACAAPGEWLARVASAARRGAGENGHVVIETASLVGSGLWHEGALAHCAAFGRAES